MAAFNATFGTLPTPKQDLFGNAPQPRRRATNELGQRELAPGAVMNFADMQKNGQARPAPTATPAPPPPMLSSLSSQLQQPVTPPPSPPPMMAASASARPPMINALQTTLETPVMGEATSTPVTPGGPVQPVTQTPVPPTSGQTTPSTPPSATTPTPSPTTTPSNTPGVTYNDDGSVTVTNVETPDPNAPKYTAGQPIDPNAPNGSTYTEANGRVWVKRGGMWVVEGGSAASGYSSLNPLAITGANGTTGGGFAANGLDQFLRQYGTPSTPEEWATLAANSGMTVDQLRAFVGQQTGISRYESQQGMADIQEQTAWMKDPANQSMLTSTGALPYDMVFVPARLGGPKLRRMTYDEAVAAGYTPYGGRALWENPDLYKGQYGVGVGGGGGATGETGGGGSGGNSGNFSGLFGQNTSSPFLPSSPSGVQYQLPNYSALLQNLNGMLGTGNAPATGGYSGSAQAIALRQQLEAKLAEMAGGNDAQKKAFDATRKARADEMTAQYGAERSKLEEELAARGLSASTIGGGRYGDLAGQQARAMATFEADMLKQQSEADARDRALYLSTTSDLAGMAGTQDLATYNANLDTKKMESDIAFKAAELQQEAALKGRELDITTARDLATKALGYAEIASREKLQQMSQTFQQGESALERNLRLTLQKNDLAASKTQGDLDRALQKEIANGNMTLSQGNSYRQIVAGIWDGTIPLVAWETLLRSIGLDPKNYPAPPQKPSGSTSTPSTPPGGTPVGPGGPGSGTQF